MKTDRFLAFLYALQSKYKLEQIRELFDRPSRPIFPKYIVMASCLNFNTEQSLFDLNMLFAQIELRRTEKIILRRRAQLHA